MTHYLRELAATYALRDKPEPADWFSIFGGGAIVALTVLSAFGKNWSAM